MNLLRELTKCLIRQVFNYVNEKGKKSRIDKEEHTFYNEDKKLQTAFVLMAIREWQLRGD